MKPESRMRPVGRAMHLFSCSSLQSGVSTVHKELRAVFARPCFMLCQTVFYNVLLWF